MWALNMGFNASVTTSVVLALGFTFLSDLLFSQQSELWSELGNWVLLPFLFRARNAEGLFRWSYSDSSPQQRGCSKWLWVMAVGLGLSSCYEAEMGKVVLYVRYRQRLGLYRKRLTCISPYWCLCCS